MKPRKSRYWTTFLPIPSPQTRGEPPLVDNDWLASRGIYPGAPEVIVLLQRHLVPLVNGLRRELAGYHFALHDRNSGVPTTEDDFGFYVHLHLRFKRPFALDAVISNDWKITRARDSIEGDSVPGGVNADLMWSWKNALPLLEAQSAWVVKFLTAHRGAVDPAKMVLQVRQFLHYFANMLQIKVVG